MGEQRQVQEETLAPRDDWFDGQVKVGTNTHERFPLEWIDQAYRDAPPRARDGGVHQRVVLHEARRFDRIAWGILGLVWVMGIGLGVGIGGMVAVARRPIAEQLALTAGYRALLFRPTLAVK